MSYFDLTFYKFQEGGYAEFSMPCLSFVQGEDEEDEDDEEDNLAKNLRNNEVEMDGPTRDELEQAAEEEFNLSEDEDMKTGMATMLYV